MCQCFSARPMQSLTTMCGWILAILFVPKKSSPISTPWQSDLSGIPFSNRRAYGRLIETPFACQQATIKKLPPIQFIKSGDGVGTEFQVYALTLTSNFGAKAIVYFTRKTGLEIQNIDYRRRPNEVVSSSSDGGITSVQFLVSDRKSGAVRSHVYRSSFSARVSLKRLAPNLISGSIIVVYPDSRRSFVSGAFKADVIDSESS